MSVCFFREGVEPPIDMCVYHTGSILRPLGRRSLAYSPTHTLRTIGCLRGKAPPSLVVSDGTLSPRRCLIPDVHRMLP